MSFILYFFRTYGFIKGLQAVTPIKYSFLLSAWFAWLLLGNIKEDANLIYLPVNFVIGYLLAIPFVLFIQTAAMAGDLLDMVRGQSFSQIINPLTKVESSGSAALLQPLLLAILVHYGMLPYLFFVLSSSFSMFPINSFFSEGIIAKLVNVSVVILDKTFNVAIPLTISCLLIEVCLLMLGKLQSIQGNYASELITIKTALLIGCLIAAFTVFEPLNLRVFISSLYQQILQKS